MKIEKHLFGFHIKINIWKPNHPERRAHERYGLILDKMDLDFMVLGKIKMGFSRKVRNLPDQRELHEFNWHGNPVRVVYYKPAQCIVTFLPNEGSYTLGDAAPGLKNRK